MTEHTYTAADRVNVASTYRSYDITYSVGQGTRTVHLDAEEARLIRDELTRLLAEDGDA
jgi:hypothetical protein